MLKADSILEKIREERHAFRQSEQKVAEYILTHPREVIGSPITELAEVIGAVSYTHLDVYKRQVIGLLCIGCVVIPFASILKTLLARGKSRRPIVLYPLELRSFPCLAKIAPRDRRPYFGCCSHNNDLHLLGLHDRR